MKALKSILTASLLGGALVLAPMTASSQEPAQNPAASAPSKADIGDEKLGQFVDAFVEVRELEQGFTSKLENIEDQEEAQALQQQTQQEMIGAVEDAGLSVEEYNNIVAAMRQDPELRDEILSQVE
ncbi:MAG: DUF4168 domain-containing protein [Pseudomonadota bacterium]